MRSNHMTTRIRKIFSGDLDHPQPKLKIFMGLFKRPVAFIASRSPNILLVMMLALAFLRVPAGSAQSNQACIRKIRVLEGDETGLTNPAGLAFSLKGNAFHVAEAPEQSPATYTDLVKVTPFAHRADTARISALVQNPINMA